MAKNGFREAPKFRGRPKSTEVHAEQAKGPPVQPPPERELKTAESTVCPDWLHLVHTLGVGELADRLTINLLKLHVLKAGDHPWKMVRERCFSLVVAICRFVFGSDFATDDEAIRNLKKDLTLAPAPVPELPHAEANTRWLEFFDNLLAEQAGKQGAVFFIGTIANLAAYNTWLWNAEDDARRPEADRTELLRIQYLNACRVSLKHTLSNLGGGDLDLDPKKYSTE